MPMRFFFLLGVVGAVACSANDSNSALGQDDLRPGTDGDNPSSPGSSGGSAAMAASSGGAAAIPGESPEFAATCAGEFGSGRELLKHGRSSSPALSGDGLELYYVYGDAGAELFYLSRRSSLGDSFEPGNSIDSLNSQCQPTDSRSIDISADALRAYISCYAEISDRTQLVQFARTRRNDAFANGREIGEMFASSSLTNDELRAVSASFIDGGGTWVATRASLEDSFGAMTPLPGLDTLSMFAPVISFDELELYGATNQAGTKRLSVVRRLNLEAEFSAPEQLSRAGQALSHDGAPTISQDCKSLIYVGVNSSQSFALYESTR